MARRMIRKDSGLAIIAGLAFVPLFIVRGAGPLDFWWWMSAAIIIVGGLSLAIDKPYRTLLVGDLGAGAVRRILLGIVSAGLLYLAFFGLNIAARHVFPMGAADIGRVYALKAQAPAARVTLLIFFLIGPGEEIIWRGFLQRHWEERWGFPGGWLAASGLYAAIHLGSGNTMLVLAAGAAGLFWGLLYHRHRSVLLNAVSHTLWDILIFIALPLSS